MSKFLITLSFIMLTVVGSHAEDSKAANQPTKDSNPTVKEQLKDERDAVLAACAEESKAGGCGDKSVGKGLLKCIYEHKKASQDFKISDGCKTAMKALRKESRKIKAEKE